MAAAANSVFLVVKERVSQDFPCEGLEWSRWQDRRGMGSVQDL